MKFKITLLLGVFSMIFFSCMHEKEEAVVGNQCIDLQNQEICLTKYKEKGDNGKSKRLSFIDSNDNYQGLSIFFKENTDSIDFVMNFVDGAREGAFIDFHSNGKIKTVGNLINGKKNGMFHEYTSNGELYSIEEYVQTVLTDDEKKGEVSQFRNQFIKITSDSKIDYGVSEFYNSEFDSEGNIVIKGFFGTDYDFNEAFLICGEDLLKRQDFKKIFSEIADNYLDKKEKSYSFVDSKKILEMNRDSTFFSIKLPDSYNHKPFKGIVFTFNIRERDGGVSVVPIMIKIDYPSNMLIYR